MAEETKKSDFDLVEYEGVDCVPIITQLAGQVKGLPYSPLELAGWILANINSPDLRIWFVIQNKEIKGFYFAQVLVTPPSFVPYIAIQLAYVSGEVKGVSEKMLEIIKGWAKEKNIHTIRLSTRNHLKGFQKKYKFTVEQTILKMEV